MNESSSRRSSRHMSLTPTVLSSASTVPYDNAIFHQILKKHITTLQLEKEDYINLAYSVKNGDAMIYHDVLNMTYDISTAMQLCDAINM